MVALEYIVLASPIRGETSVESTTITSFAIGTPMSIGAISVERKYTMLSAGVGILISRSQNLFDEKILQYQMSSNHFDASLNLMLY